MINFIITLVVILGVRVVVSLWKLAVNDLPYTISFYAIDFVINLMLSSGLLIWGCILIFNGV